MTTPRYRQIIRKVMRPRNIRLAREIGLWRATDPTEEGAEQFRELLEGLGTTFIKLGQLLSTRPDLIPPLYAEKLTILQDDVIALTSADVENVVIEAFGTRPAGLFQSFDPMPLASASIAQTHRVVLKGGEKGVIKVRRPGIDKQVDEDLAILRKLAIRIEKRLDIARFIQLKNLVEELAVNLRQELDLRQDAANMKLMADSLSDFDQIHIPRVFDQWTHETMIVMEEIEGVRVDSASEMPENANELAEQLLRCYLRQIAVDGIYHADPHGGNVLLTEGGRLALLDFGLLGRIDDSTRSEMALLLMAIGENRGEDVSDMLIRMSTTSRSSDEQVFAREIRRLLPQFQRSLGQLSIGNAMVSIQRLAIDCRVALPLSFALIGKTLSQVDSIARRLSPDIDPMQVIRDYEPRLIAAQLQKKANPGSAFEGFALPMMAAWRIPQHVEHLLSKAEKGELKFGIVPTELDEAVKEVRTLTNRLAWAIVSSAMIVASALLMNVKNVGTFFGYPALGLVGFVLAFFFGIMLLWRMIRTPGGL